MKKNNSRIKNSKCKCEGIRQLFQSKIFSVHMYSCNMLIVG